MADPSDLRAVILDLKWNKRFQLQGVEHKPEKLIQLPGEDNSAPSYQPARTAAQKPAPRLKLKPKTDACLRPQRFMKQTYNKKSRLR
jgi:hypothetical protein